MKSLQQFNNILVYVLLGAGFVKMMVGLWLDSAIILSVVILNALLGFIQEGKAEKALDSIRNMLSAEARTLRGGETRLIPSEELVPGDVVLLESGDKVPADLRLVEVKNLRTEEAALTGESVPIDKTTNAVSDKATIGDREGMAFSGTLVASGARIGVVVATGSNTELGHINQMMTSVSALETPLLRQIKKFGYSITVVIGVVTVLVFAYGRWIQSMGFVGHIPEGHQHCGVGDPGRIARTHYSHARDRRAAHGSAQRDHPAPAGSGNSGFGLAYLFRQDRHLDLDGNDGSVGGHCRISICGYRRRIRARRPGDEGRPTRGRRSGTSAHGPCLHAMQRFGDTPGGGTVEGKGLPDRKVRSTRFANKLGFDRKTAREKFPRIDAIPFESEHKFMATLHKDADGKRMILVKGAPEVILEHCTHQATIGGAPAPLAFRLFLTSFGQACGAGRACAGFGVA